MKFLLVIPAHNEEKIIEQSLLTLNYFLRQNFDQNDYRVIVADNNSNDSTGLKIKALLPSLSGFEYLFEPKQGKGAALRAGFEKGEQVQVCAFMDADLATDLKSLPSLLKSASEIGAAIGDRYNTESKVFRTRKRLIISQIYRLLARIILNSKISDFPCGFKAFRNDVLFSHLPKVENNSWFFDSELIGLIEKSGIIPVSIPVEWNDPRSKVEESKVDIVKVGSQYLSELLRLRKKFNRSV